MTITLRRFGSSLTAAWTLSSCSWFSTKMISAPECPTTWATWLEEFVT